VKEGCVIFRDYVIPGDELVQARHVLPAISMRKVFTATWKIGVFLILWAGLYAPLLIPVARKFALDKPFVRLYVELTGAATILAAAWIMLHVIDRRPLVSLGFTSEHAVRDLCTGIALGSAMMAVCVAILTAAGWAIWLPMLRFSLEAVARGALSMIANTITQEVMVRGYVQQTLDFEFGTLKAVLLSACFFTLLHAGVIRTLISGLNLFAAGVLLGVACAVTRKLWLPIGIHFAWNFLQGPILGMRVSAQDLSEGSQMLQVRGPVIFTGGPFGIEGGLVALTVTVAASAVFLATHYTRRGSTADAPPAYPPASSSASFR
jgi:membrane protease YdiL (CAAX protease family)